jgi:hypothetical protein
LRTNAEGEEKKKKGTTQNGPEEKSMAGSMMEHLTDPVPGGMRRKLGT